MLNSEELRKIMPVEPSPYFAGNNLNQTLVAEPEDI
jgi:hypothetical protein